MSTISPTVNGIPAYRLQVKWALGVPEDISYTVYGPQAASLLAGQIPPNNGVLPVTFDGSTVIAQMLSNGAQLVYDQPGYVAETGKSIAQALQGAHIPRLTGQQVPLIDLFTAQAGYVRTVDTNTIATGHLPNAQGISQFPTGLPNNLAFVYNLGGAIQDVILDIDINEDNILHAIDVIMQRLGSAVDPQQTMYYFDTGTTPTVAIGTMGASSIAFDGTTIPVLRQTTAQAQTTDMCASCTFKGGDTHHGLPTSGHITSMVVLANGASAGMAAVAVYAKIDVGGVYCFPGDGSLYPISQAMGVTDLWYYPGAGTLYAATDAGVYSGPDDATNTAPWPRLGAMSLKCLKVMRSVDQIYCLAEFAGSQGRAVLKYTPGTTLGQGYDDWTVITSNAGITDFVVTDNYCYYLLRNSAGVIGVWGFTGGGQSPIVVPGGAAVTGLDPLSDGNTTNGVFVRTDQGSAQLYIFFDGETSVALANTDGSLHDAFGAPVMVNKVVPNANGELTCASARRPSNLLAATTLGVFTTGDPNGEGGWTRTDGQSQLGDFTVTTVAAGPSQGDYQYVYAAAAQALYYSPNGSVNWIDVMSEPLDAGPYYASIFRQEGRWPGNSGTSLKVPYGSSVYTLERTRNGLGQWSYQLVNPNSQAPAKQHRSAALTEISAPALMSEVAASGLLVQAMARFLAYTGRPQVITDVASVAFDTTSQLFSVRPTWGASASGVAMEYIVGQGAPFSLGSLATSGYVLEHTITYDRDVDPGAVTTLTRIGTLLLDDRSDPLRVTADIFYQVSRLQLYRGRSHH